MAKKRDRSEDEIAQDFIGAPGAPADADLEAEIAQLEREVGAGVDEPEPDALRLAGLTSVGRVEDGTSRVASYPAPGTPTAPGLNGLDLSSIDPSTLTMDQRIQIALVEALSKVAAGQANSQQVATEALNAASRQTQPDNKFAPGVSVFNPQGDLTYARPRLKCEMFIPWEAEAESLTWEEIELLNLLQEGEFFVKRNDDTKVPITVRIEYNLGDRTKPNRLLMNSETSFNNDNHWMLPPLTSILRQVLNQKPETRRAAQDVPTMDDRLDMIRSGELPVSVGAR